MRTPAHGERHPALPGGLDRGAPEHERRPGRTCAGLRSRARQRRRRHQRRDRPPCRETPHDTSSRRQRSRARPWSSTEACCTGTPRRPSRPTRSWSMTGTPHISSTLGRDLDIASTARAPNTPPVSAQPQSARTSWRSTGSRPGRVRATPAARHVGGRRSGLLAAQPRDGHCTVRRVRVRFVASARPAGRWRTVPDRRGVRTAGHAPHRLSASMASGGAAPARSVPLPDLAA